jgi:hypothetical protein
MNKRLARKSVQFVAFVSTTAMLPVSVVSGHAALACFGITLVALALTVMRKNTCLLWKIM